MKVLLQLTLICFTSTAITLGQADDGRKSKGKRRSPDALVKALNLTPEQLTTLKDLRRLHAESMRPLHGELRELSRQLKEEMSKETANPAIAGQFLIDMKSRRHQAKAMRLQFQDQARGVLGEQQQASLETLERSRQLKRAVGEATRLGLLTPKHNMRHGQSAPGNSKGHRLRKKRPSAGRGFGRQPGRDRGFGGRDKGRSRGAGGFPL